MLRQGHGRSSGRRNGDASWAPTMETPDDARTHRRSNGDGEHFARSVLAPPEEKGGQPRLACWTGSQPPTSRKLSGRVGVMAAWSTLDGVCPRHRSLAAKTYVVRFGIANWGCGGPQNPPPAVEVQVLPRDLTVRKPSGPWCGPHQPLQ